jgi:DNA mismatch repair protein MutS2
VDKAAEKYYKTKKKRPLISDLLRIVETENSKRKPKASKPAKEITQPPESVKKELHREVQTIRKKKKAEKRSAEKSESKKPRPVFKIGDQVRLSDSKSVGSIDRIEKQKALVNYGMFTTEVSVDQLELVSSGRS